MIVNQQLVDDILSNKYGKCLKSEALNKYIYNLEFSVFLSHNCNYNCSYCFVKNKDNKEQILKYINKYDNLKYRLNKNNKSYSHDIKKFNRLLDITLQLKHGTKICFILLGGEPTLCTNLFEIIKLHNEYRYKYKNMYSRLVIDTNGSLSTEYFENLLKICNNDVKLVITFHNEFANVNHFKELENMFLYRSYNNYTFKFFLNYDDDLYSTINKTFINNSNIMIALLHGTTKYNNSNSLNTKNSLSTIYKLTFENKEIELSNIEMLLLGNNKYFNGMKCYNNMYSIYNNQIIQLCNRKTFDLNNNSFINYYNNTSYIYCNNYLCHSGCKIKQFKER